MRGFGGPEGSVVMEEIINRIAHELKLDANSIKEVIILPWIFFLFSPVSLLISRFVIDLRYSSKWLLHPAVRIFIHNLKSY
jgi:hypothetical protein